MSTITKKSNHANRGVRDKECVDGEVYVITNKINNKQYVGITTEGYEFRFRDHIYSAKRKRSKGRSAIQSAIRKYGKNSFEIKVIDRADTWKKLCELEAHYIDCYDTYGKGYNLTRGGEGCWGRKLSSETREKLSRAHLKIPPTEKSLQKCAEANRKPVYQYGWDGKFIVEHPSIVDAGKAIERSPNTITTCLTGGHDKTAGGCQFRYAENEQFGVDIEPIIGSIQKFTLDGELVGIYRTQKEAVESMGVSGVSQRPLSKHLREGTDSYLGYKWIRKRDRVYSKPRKIKEVSND